MIVECQACTTRFQLDESRIPASGIRVRCSRCKEAFFLPHPSASEEEVVEAVAGEAAATAAPSPPAPAEDLAENGAASDDEDWEFTDDFPGAEREPVRADAADEDSPFGGAAGIDFAADEAASGLELANEPESPAAADPHDADPEAQTMVAAAAEPALEAAAPVAASEASSPPATDPVAETVVAQAPPTPSLAAATEASAAAMAEESLASAGADDSLGAQADGGAELGEPEDWDFFSDDAIEGQPAEAEAPPLRMAAAQTTAIAELPSGPAIGHVSSELRADRLEPVRKLGHAVGWLVVAVLFSVALFRGLHPPAAPVVSAGPQLVAGFEVHDISTSWVETAQRGSMLSVRGRLHNPAPVARVPAIGLQIELLDAAGNAIDVPPATAGVGLQADDVRELGPQALLSVQDRAAEALSWTPLRSGGETSFVATFDEVPAEAVGLRVSALPLERGEAAAGAQGEAQANDVQGIAGSEPERLLQAGVPLAP